MSTGSPPYAIRAPRPRKLNGHSAVGLSQSTPHEAHPEMPPKLYRIGELAEFSGLSRQTLHNYTRWGLIQEAQWTAGGHRVYGQETFAKLRKIIELKRTCSMDEIRSQLQEIV